MVTFIRLMNKKIEPQLAGYIPRQFDKTMEERLSRQP